MLSRHEQDSAGLQDTLVSHEAAAEELKTEIVDVLTRHAQVQNGLAYARRRGEELADRLQVLATEAHQASASPGRHRAESGYDPHAGRPNWTNACGSASVSGARRRDGLQALVRGRGRTGTRAGRGLGQAGRVANPAVYPQRDGAGL